MATSRQLLFRAGEIKQPKRREALIENAEKARISRQLVLLDDKVDLEVPLDDLAVHEPDARKLIAFLKAMEFSTLTRRVAEYSQIDPSDVEAGCRQQERRRAFSSVAACRAQSADGDSDRAICSAAASPRQQGGAPEQGRRQAGQGREPKGHADFAGRRARRSGAKIAGRSQQVSDHPQPRSSSRPGSRARYDAGHFAIEAMANSIDPMQAEICGIALALAPNDACYVPLAHKQSGGGAGLFDAGPRARPDQGRRRACGAEAAAGIGRHSQDRLQHQVQRRDAGAARHHRCATTTTRS